MNDLQRALFLVVWHYVRAHADTMTGAAWVACYRVTDALTHYAQD